MRVVLSAYADAVSGPGELTLLQYVTDLINHRASDPINVTETKKLMVKWPTLLVLDGLDEVSSATVRAEVSTRIVDFLTEMAAAQADVLVLCTSRPIGYEDDERVGYERLELLPLTVDDATHYARRLLAKRFQDNPDRQDLTLQRIVESANNDDIAKVMTTPLQVTILTLILERRTRAPASRWALFSAYYETIFARECNKAGALGELLERHQGLINEIHQRCALTIHCRAERAGDAESILPVDEVERIAQATLDKDGFAAAAAESLIEQLLRLERERLVLMVPRQDGLAFEVRSLTEFFAARALMADEDVADTLQLLTPSAHWNNTWLLAAGHIFSERRSLRDAVVARLDRTDQDSWASPAGHARRVAGHRCAGRRSGRGRAGLRNPARAIRDAPAQRADRLARDSTRPHAGTADERVSADDGRGLPGRRCTNRARNAGGGPRVSVRPRQFGRG